MKTQVSTTRYTRFNRTLNGIEILGQHGGNLAYRFNRTLNGIEIMLNVRLLWIIPLSFNRTLNGIEIRFVSREVLRVGGF